MINSLRCLILSVVGMGLCGGCATMTFTYYDGPRQPNAELGMIKAGVVSSIGGKDISYLAGRKIQVLPGNHVLGISGTRQTAEGESADFHCILQIAVEAGHVYEGFIQSGVSGGKDTAVAGVTDKTSDQVVAKYQPQANCATPRAQLPDPAPMRLMNQPNPAASLASSL
jgi:hypothetical protein